MAQCKACFRFDFFAAMRLHSYCSVTRYRLCSYTMRMFLLVLNRLSPRIGIANYMSAKTLKKRKCFLINAITVFISFWLLINGWHLESDSFSTRFFTMKMFFGMMILWFHVTLLQNVLLYYKVEHAVEFNCCDANCRPNESQIK